jgi:glycosyltransferase involved in cell wall biosynthesis
MAGQVTDVTIVMATLNGADHLQAQLDSLLAQTHRDWRLWVSDDGSTDGTLTLLQAFARASPAREVRLIRGPGAGSAANFLAVLCHPDLPPGPVALCDQDDVWLKGKLARALRRLAGAPPDVPVLYAAESWRCDADLATRRPSRAPRTGPCFANALVQNLCAGHTIVLNEAARALVRRAGPAPGIAFHDWWLYQLVTGAGGVCLLDPLPVTLYRQHGRNLFGAPGGLRAMRRRLRKLIAGDYATWVEAHRMALAASGLLTPEAQQIAAALHPARTGRAATIRACRLRRDMRAGTLALHLAALIGRV